MLWKFDFMVEGKNLEKVMSALAGVALEFQTPMPVSNGVSKSGKVRQQVSGVTNPDRVMNKLIDDGVAVPGQYLSTATIKMAMDGLHISKGNYGGIIKKLSDKGLLTTTERRGTLKVL